MLIVKSIIYRTIYPIKIESIIIIEYKESK